MNKELYFSGIGSRSTPDNIMSKMKSISHYLTSKGFYLNSGGATGADSAFEEGAIFEKRRIYLPKEGFNKKHSNGKEYIVPPYNEELIKKYHPKFEALTKDGRLFMSKNSYQVLGYTLEKPVDFVVCWTEGGKMKGGTAQAMRIAMDYNIPIFNLYRVDTINLLKNFLEYKGYI